MSCNTCQPPSSNCTPFNPCVPEDYGSMFPSLVGPPGPPGGPGTFVPNYALLRLLNPVSFTSGYIAYIAGADTINDGGSGMFEYNPVATDADNDGTIIRPSNGIGRWFRIFDGWVNAKWFHAKGNGATDDTAALQRAIDFANGGRTVYAPMGRYIISASLIPAKGPTNAGAWGSFILQGDGNAYVDDIFGADNYGTTIFMTPVVANTPAFYITNTRGCSISFLNIIGSSSYGANTVGLQFVNFNKNTNFNRVTIGGFSECIQIGLPGEVSSANNDEFTITNSLFEVSDVAVSNYGVESFAVNCSDTVIRSATAYKTTSHTDATVMNSFKAYRCKIFGTLLAEAVSMHGPLSLSGRDLIVFDSCLYEPSGATYGRLFTTNVSNANNHFGLVITNCTLNIGSNHADMFDPAFATLKYKGRGPFVFERNIIGGPGRIVFDLQSLSSGQNASAMRMQNNVFTTARPTIRWPQGDPMPTLLEQGNEIQAEAAQKVSDPFLAAVTQMFPEPTILGQKLTNRAPLDLETWLVGSKYTAARGGLDADFECYSAGTAGTVTACTGTVVNGNDFATIVSGANAERRKIYAGTYITIGASIPLLVRDVINDTIYLHAVYAGATQTAQALGFTPPNFRAIVQRSNAAPAAGSWLAGDKVYYFTLFESGAPGSMYVIIGQICITSGTPGTWREMRVLTGN